MNDRAWNGVGIAACVAAGAVLVYHVLSPIKGPGKAVQTKANEERKQLGAISRIRGEVSDLKTKNEAVIWTQDPDQVAATSMAKITTLAAAKGLKLIAFRPQRAQDDGVVNRYPYLVALEGTYPNVVAFLGALETPGSKLAVSQVQIAANDGATDKVSATVGVVAYREMEVKK
jgi:Tfp pilus assembly protein PilO